MIMLQWRSAWFEGTATQDAGASIFYHLGCFCELVFILNSTRTCHDYDTLAPNLNPINGNQAVRHLEFP
ncbi:unnamed protein product [marine sediment metagenome]|uniref:Uncharacterized protein n=1 Tax=marine sediment metagenome TaxID=412755 RepID=X1UQZ8_9ZZZZ